MIIQDLFVKKHSIKKVMCDLDNLLCVYFTGCLAVNCGDHAR